MIAVLSRDGRFRRFVESVLCEHRLPLSSLSSASLVIVDLDTASLPRAAQSTVTVSSDIFVKSDLLRPFSQEELVLLCQKRLGWQPTVAPTAEVVPEGEEFTVGEGCVFRYGERIILTPAEFRLFVLLYKNRGKTVPHAECEAACRVRTDSGNSVSVTLASLRKKLDYRFKAQYFASVRGVGYRMLE